MAPNESLCNRRGRSRLLAQDELLNLPRGRLRERAEHDTARCLEMGEQVAAVLDELALSYARIRFQLDERARCLAPLLVRLRDDCRGKHRRVAMQRILDLERRNVLA